MNISKVEQAIKTLGRTAEVAREASRSIDGLDEKVRFCKLAKDINRLRTELLKNYYEIEDAIAITERYKETD